MRFEAMYFFVTWSDNGALDILKNMDEQTTKMKSTLYLLSLSHFPDQPT